MEWGSRDNPSVDLTPGLSPTLKPRLKGLEMSIFSETGYFEKKKKSSYSTTITLFSHIYIFLLCLCVCVRVVYVAIKIPHITEISDLSLLTY